MKIVIGTVLALLLSVTAFAKDVVYTACTADTKAVQLAVTLNDDVIAQDNAVIAHVGKAFSTAATQLTAEALMGREGFIVFINELSDVDRLAITGITAPTVIEGSCK